MVSNLFLSDQITITSETGVGGTTAYDNLKKLLVPSSPAFAFVSGSEIMTRFRLEYAEKIGREVLKDDFVEYITLHQEEGYDWRCDDELREAGLKNYMVIESRLCHIMAPHGFHVLLECPIAVRACRRFGKSGISTGIDTIKTRDASDVRRYDNLYPGWNWAREDYDIRINTDRHNEEGVARKILEEHVKWKARMRGKIFEKLPLAVNFFAC